MSEDKTLINNVNFTDPITKVCGWLDSKETFYHLPVITLAKFTSISFTRDLTRKKW